MYSKILVAIDLSKDTEKVFKGRTPHGKWRSQQT